MAVSAAERRFLLDQVDRLAQNDLIKLWDSAERLEDGGFFDFVVTGFPEIASTYYELAGQVAANWFEESIPLPDYTAKPAELLPAQRLIESAQWALGGDGVQARERLSGTLQRAVYDGARDTTAVNAEATGSRWIRVARADACEFCKLLATRTDENYTYRSKEAALGVVGRSVNLSDADRRAIASGQMTRQEALERRDRMATTYQIGRRKGQARSRRLRGTRQYGAKYHDFCHCTAKEIPAGVDALELLAQDDPQSAALVEQWTEEYQKARANAGTGSTKQILSEWRKQPAVQQPVTINAFDRKILDSADSVETVANYISGKHGIKVDQLVNSPLAKGIPIDESLRRGVDVLSAAQAAKPHFIDQITAREFGQAVDDMLEKYPFLTLDEIKADFYPTGNPLSSVAHASSRPTRDGARYVAVNQFADVEGQTPGTARNRYAQSIAQDSYDNRYKAVAQDRPVYAVMIHEMGHVVDFNSGGKAQERAALALREYIKSLPEAQSIKELPKIKIFAERYTSVNEVFTYSTEYQDFERQWLRDNLVSSYSFKDSDRNAGVYLTEALAEAFADVELRGDKAETASKIIHKAMIDAARENKQR